jgi:polyhydroxyalkanoate synthase
MLKTVRRIRHITRNAQDRFLRPDTLVQAGQTPYTVIADDGLVKLRHYRPVQRKYAVPFVIVPPLAVNMLIYDLFPERSLVRFMVEQGFDVYMVDWGSPTRQHAHYTLATYACKLLPAFLQRVRQHSGQPELTLHGWSMGGGIALVYTALSGDPDIRNIIAVGTAIDGHANGAIGRQYAALNSAIRRLGINWRRIPSRWAYTPGWINAIGFKLSDPVNSARSYVDLIRNLDDREFVVQHATQSAFKDRLEPYPGGVIRDWTYSVWLENEAGQGRISVGQDVAYLERIGANLLCIAGTSDTLANVACCKKLLDLVSSPDKSLLVAPGGHTGIVSGSQAIEAVWQPTVEWLASRSDA